MRHTLLDSKQAAALLQLGQVVAYPTEAVFGLGCDPANESAVHQLLSLKQRPVSAGLILIASHFSQLEGWVGPVDDDALQSALDTWPGPVTWLFPKGPLTRSFISGKHDSVAVRITAHQPSAALCDAFGGPLVSTSANPRSAEPARSAATVEDYFGSQIGGIVEGALGGNDQPSEIRDLSSGTIIRASS